MEINSYICLNNRGAQESDSDDMTVSVFVFHTIQARVAVCS